MKIEEIKGMFDRAYGFDIATKTRLDEYVQARKAYCKLTRELGFGLQNIGKSINRDHTTVLHCLSTSQTIRDFDVKVYDRILELVKSCREIEPLTDNKEAEVITKYRSKIQELQSEVDALKSDSSIEVLLAKEISSWDSHYVKDFIETRLKPYKLINKL